MSIETTTVYDRGPSPQTTEAETRRVTRALTQDLVVDDAEYNHDDVYAVHSESGNSYVVNAENAECSCPDNQNGYTCKHYYAVVFKAGLDPLDDGDDDECPACEAMNDDLGCFDCYGVESECQECASLSGDLGCFSCFEGDE